MRPSRWLALFAIVGAGLFAASLLTGAGSLAGVELDRVLLSVRLQRGLVAYLAGAALAVAGVMAQGLFRNPLASPDVLGTTAGASLFGKLSLLGLQGLLVDAHQLGFAPELIVPLGCFVGALLSLSVLLAISRRAGDPVLLLLAGFLLSSLFFSLGALVTSLAQESWELGRAVVSFSLGSVSGAGAPQVALLLPIAVAGSCAAIAWSRPLDLLLSGEDEARVLGLDVRETRRWCIAWAALLTAGAVSVGGSLGFVGLVVPHALRRLLGASHRRLVPAAALGGGAFVLACDMLVRTLPSRSEVPLGVVTGLIGAPLFLVLLLRARRAVLHG